MKREPFKGYWRVVGGHVEENETLKEALKLESTESEPSLRGLEGYFHDVADQVCFPAALHDF